MKWELSQSYYFHGREIRYDRLGQGQPIILVHGTPWSSFNLRHLIHRLSVEYEVFFYDLLGYGQSSKEEGDVSLGIQNQALDALIDHWNLDTPTVIGHDFGGAVALRTHIINQRDFKKIVLIDPVAVSPWGSPFFTHVAQYQEAFSGLPENIHKAVVRSYIETAIHTQLDEDTLNRTILPWICETGKAAFYRQIAQADSRYTEEIQPSYKRISKPTLIVWGREDTWVPIERGRKLHRMIPNSTFRVVEDCGHLLIEEKPMAVAQEILDFIRD